MPKKIKEENIIPIEPIKLEANQYLITEEDNTYLGNLLAQLISSQHWCFDVETDAKHFMIAKLDGIGFYFPSGESYYINVYKSSDKWVNQIIDTLRPHFENEKTGKIGFNILYDMHIMKNYNVTVKGPICDAMIESYLVNPDDRPFKLKTLAPKHLKIEMRKYKEIDRENILDMAVYCMEDSRCTYLLYQNRKVELIKNNMWRLFIDIEMPFLRVLFDMERRGIKVDIERLTLMRSLINKGMNNYRKMFYRKMFGTESENVTVEVIKKVKKQDTKVIETFNLDSTHHLGALLYTNKKYPVLSKTPGKKPSTDKGALEKLAEKGFEGMEELVKYRQMQKLLSGFIDPILSEHMINGRIYPSYLQHGTRTGRLSSSNPNFQNIPVRTTHGKALRRCFIADDGYKLIDADLSQIELRVMAHFSKDPQLIWAFENDKDLHDLEGQTVFGLPEGATNLPKNKTIRTICKNLNFGMQYGAGGRKLANLANTEIMKENKRIRKRNEHSKDKFEPEKPLLTEDEAKEYIETHFKKYSMVKAFQKLYPNEVRRTGYATTVLGRKRYLPNIKKKPYTGDKIVDKENWKKMSHAEREALSTLIQGTAADMLKLAMIKAHSLGILLITQIHDQLLALSKKENVEKDREALKNCLENCGVKLEVPVVAKILVVDRWEQESESVVEQEENLFEA